MAKHSNEFKSVQKRIVKHVSGFLRTELAPDSGFLGTELETDTPSSNAHTIVVNHSD